MKKVCLINVFFGTRWPDYFLYFLQSCKDNPDVNFLIFSNIELPIEISNVCFVYLKDLTDFNELASSKLGFEINIVEPYKLCDFKPAYGKIFEDFLVTYDFWGYCDIDLVFGNIRSFIDDKMLSSYDIISAREEYPSGFFTLYRNTQHISSLFMLSRDYTEIFQQSRHYCFDECNFQFVQLLINKNTILDIKTEIESMALVIARAVNDKYLRYHHSTIVEEFLDDSQATICYNKGTLSDIASHREYLLVHLINVKNLHSFNISVFMGADVFYISNKGIGISRGFSLGNYIIERKRIATTHMRYIMWYVKYLLFRLRNYNAESICSGLDNKTYMVGNIKCSFRITDGNILRTIIQTEDEIVNEKGKLYPINRNVNLYAVEGKLFLFKIIFSNSNPIKFELRNLRTDRVDTGYLSNTFKYSYREVLDIISEN